MCIRDSDNFEGTIAWNCREISNHLSKQFQLATIAKYLSERLVIGYLHYNALVFVEAELKKDIIDLDALYQQVKEDKYDEELSRLSYIFKEYVVGKPESYKNLLKAFVGLKKTLGNRFILSSNFDEPFLVS